MNAGLIEIVVVNRHEVDHQEHFAEFILQVGLPLQVDPHVYLILYRRMNYHRMKYIRIPF
jgi:hypothetical protein